MAKWSDEQRLNALAIAESSSSTEAAEQTGIPRGTICRWMQRDKKSDSPEGVSRKAKAIAEEAVKEAKAKVRETMVDQIKQLTQDLLEVNKMTLEALRDAIQKGPNEDEANAQWVRAIGSIMAQGIDRLQLLNGEPTQRSEVKGEVTNRNEYFAIQELVGESEEVADRLLSAFAKR